MNDINKENDRNETESSIQPANIIVAGITGTGKSTLINAVFGEELAKTGNGEPVTEHIDQYNTPNTPICIWDTVGLELDSKKTKQSIDNIKNTIAEKSKSENHLDVIHAIWYCINSASNRYQGEELNFIKDLHSIGVPFIVVLTQCVGAEDEINEFEKKIREVNKREGMNDIDVVQVLAQDYSTRLGSIPAFGLRDLVNVTIDSMPEFLKNGFVAAQKVDKMQKRVRSEEIIYDTVRLVKFGKYRIFGLNILFTNSKMLTMFEDIGKMYNIILTEEKLKDLVDGTSIDLENIWGGFLSPFKSKYSKKVNTLLDAKREVGFDVNLDITKYDRAAQVVAFYGYTFLETLEELWDKYTEEELKKIEEDIVGVIKERMNKKFSEA